MGLILILVVFGIGGWFITGSLLLYYITVVNKLQKSAKDLQVAFEEYKKSVVEELPMKITDSLYDKFRTKG